MPLKNTPARYGAVSKFLHWTLFLLFVHQFVGANLFDRSGFLNRMLPFRGSR